MAPELSSNIDNNLNAKSSARTVYKTILDDILNKFKTGELHGGDRLPSERQWAEQLGVSRSTLREAIRSLEIIGLLTSRQGGGTYIVTSQQMSMLQTMTVSFWLNQGSAEDIHEYRKSLEITSAELAAKKATDEDIKVMYDLLEKIRIETDINQNFYKAARYDQDLHTKIAECSGNCLVRDSLASVGALMNDIIYGLRSEILKEPKDAAALAQYHRAIIEAIELHDSKLAAKRMAEHMFFNEKYIHQMSHESR